MPPQKKCPPGTHLVEICRSPPKRRHGTWADRDAMSEFVAKTGKPKRPDSGNAFTDDLFYSVAVTPILIADLVWLMRRKRIRAIENVHARFDAAFKEILDALDAKKDAESATKLKPGLKRSVFAVLCQRHFLV